MVSYGMLHRVALVTTDVSEELSTSFIRVTRIGELGTTTKKLRGPQSASELYRLIYRYLLTKFSVNFCG
jgi:hypothetical protein